MSDTPETLISRYLNGSVTADEVRRLDELVLTDAGVRREQFLASGLDSHLHECLAENVNIATDQAAWWRSRTVRAIAAMLLVAVGLLMFFGRYPDPTVSGFYRVVGGGPVRRG